MLNGYHHPIQIKYPIKLNNAILNQAIKNRSTLIWSRRQSQEIGSPEETHTRNPQSLNRNQTGISEYSQIFWF